MTPSEYVPALLRLLDAANPASLGQALDLLASLADPSVYDGVLEGVDIGRDGSFAPGDRFDPPGWGVNIPYRLALLTIAARAEGPNVARLRERLRVLKIQTGGRWQADGVLDLANLAHLAGLQDLTIETAYTVANAAALRDLPALLRLRVCNQTPDRALDLSGIVGHPSLERLELQGKIQGFSGPGALPRLRELTAAEGSEVPGERLAMPSIETLSWPIAGRLPIAVPSASLVSSASSELDDDDVAILAGCPKLARIEAGKLLASDLTPLADLTLESLEFGEGRRLYSLDRVPDVARSVTNLHVGNPDLTSIRGVDRWREISHLDLAGSARIGSLEGVAGLSKLTWISLDGCTSLTDVSALADLRALRFIFARGVPLPDAAFPARAKVLRHGMDPS